MSVLLISAFIVDWMLKDEVLVSQSSELKKFSLGTDEFAYHQQIGFVNKQFCLIFDAIYGKHTWSWKRFFRSTALSLFFVLFSILLIGIENSYLAPSTKKFVGPNRTDHIIAISLIFGCYNVVIDFISLLETRWVLGRAQNAGKIALGMWIAVDLILTSAIYIVSFPTMFAILSLLFDAQDSGPYLKDIQELFISVLKVFFSQNKALPFFISTFGTSIVWYMFLFFVFLVKFLRRNSRMLKIAFDIISESATPARLVVVLFSFPIIAFFVVLKGINWLASN